VWAGRALHAAVLAALMAYALAGTGAAVFHGDEAMQIYSSIDYWTAFIDGDPRALETTPPYPIDSDPHLRILNGSFNRHTIGLLLHLGGYTPADLPPRPGWDWGLSYADNAATAHRPPPALLIVARASSAVAFALAIPAFYALLVSALHGAGVARRAHRLALAGAALFALHPALLLNGRRAMQEGSVLVFGVLALVCAVAIVRAVAPTPAQAAQTRPRARAGFAFACVGFAFACALTVLSKHSGAVWAVGAGVGIVGAALAAGGLPRVRLARAAVCAAAVAVCAAAAFGLFIAGSPALWNNPADRVRDLLSVRRELLAIQAGAQPGGGLSAPERAAAIVREPFLAPVAYYEVASWGEDPTIAAETAAADRSPLNGIRWGALGGGLLTGLAGLGVGVLLTALVRGGPAAPMAAFALTVTAFTAGSLLFNPLPWQRYYLLLVPIAIALAIAGAAALMNALDRRVARRSITGA
jgi:hypothetical protein